MIKILFLKNTVLESHNKNVLFEFWFQINFADFSIHLNFRAKDEDSMVEFWLLITVGAF